MSGFEPPTAGTQNIEIEQSREHGGSAVLDDQRGSAEITIDGCASATDATELAEVLVLPARPLSPIEHATLLADLIERMLTEGRTVAAIGVLGALRKVLAADAAGSRIEEALDEQSGANKG